MNLSINHRSDGIAVITIDQAHSRANVLSTELWTDLDQALHNVAQTPGVQGLIIASAKPGIFIAGADLKLLGEATENDPRVREFINLGTSVLARLELLPFGTVAAIDGAALGGGLEVALACDFRLVGHHPKIQLGLPEVGLGLIPGWGGTQRLPRLIGLPKAVEMLTSGRSLSATEAVHADLATEQVESATLVESAASLVNTLTATLKHEARQIRTRPVPEADRAAFTFPSPETTPLRELMSVMLEGAKLPLAEALPIETAIFCQLAGSVQSKEKITAFFSRKKG